jgi:ABC-type multidrug transport system fused ATPase/permease subunit
MKPRRGAHSAPASLGSTICTQTFITDAVKGRHGVVRSVLVVVAKSGYRVTEGEAGRKVADRNGSSPPNPHELTVHPGPALITVAAAAMSGQSEPGRGAMASVGIGKVRKSYGESEVLHGVTIDIEDGEFVALVGPSGCGTTGSCLIPPLCCCLSVGGLNA